MEQRLKKKGEVREGGRFYRLLHKSVQVTPRLSPVGSPQEAAVRARQALL